MDVLEISDWNELICLLVKIVVFLLMYIINFHTTPFQPRKMAIVCKQKPKAVWVFFSCSSDASFRSHIKQLWRIYRASFSPTMCLCLIGLFWVWNFLMRHKNKDICPILLPRQKSFLSQTKSKLSWTKYFLFQTRWYLSRTKFFVPGLKAHICFGKE